MEIKKRIANIDIEIEISEYDTLDQFTIYIDGGCITVTKPEWNEIATFISNSIEFIKNN